MPRNSSHLTFESYIQAKEAVSDTPLVDAGTEQRDPDKPDNVDELMFALKDIIDTAKRALERREKGLGDSKGNKQEDDARDNRLDTIDRPKSDSPEGMFGQD